MSNGRASAFPGRSPDACSGAEGEAQHQGEDHEADQARDEDDAAPAGPEDDLALPDVVGGVGARSGIVSVGHGDRPPFTSNNQRSGRMFRVPRPTSRSEEHTSELQSL